MESCKLRDGDDEECRERETGGTYSGILRCESNIHRYMRLSKIHEARWREVAGDVPRLLLSVVYEQP